MTTRGDMVWAPMDPLYGQEHGDAGYAYLMAFNAERRRFDLVQGVLMRAREDALQAPRSEFYRRARSPESTLQYELDREPIVALYKESYRTARLEHAAECEKIWQEFVDAVSHDPIAKFVVDNIPSDLRDDALTVIDTLPSSLSEVCTLAVDKRWCKEFERIYNLAISAEVIEAEPLDLPVYEEDEYEDGNW